MHPLTRLATASLMLSVLAGNGVAQQDLLGSLLERLSLVEITSDTAPVVSFHATTKQSDAASPAALVISCRRGALADNGDMLAVQDHAARTDDRYGVNAGFCNALVDAVTKRNRAQGR